MSKTIVVKNQVGKSVTFNGITSVVSKDTSDTDVTFMPIDEMSPKYRGDDIIIFDPYGGITVSYTEAGFLTLCNTTSEVS